MKGAHCMSLYVFTKIFTSPDAGMLPSRSAPVDH
jgi:hypothetical protein